MTTAPELPATMARLPRDKHGRPIPWFVHIDEHGVPDFRVIRRDGVENAYRFGLCWVCGQPRGRWAAFLLGPMCAINRTSSEPPSHRDCAIYSALACPFLSTPTMVRRERGLEHKNVAGVMIKRNPGVALVWITRDWKPFQAPNPPGAIPVFGTTMSCNCPVAQWLLTDVAAKRQLLAVHQGEHYCPTNPVGGGSEYFNYMADWAEEKDHPQVCPVHRLLAAPFAGHPDFREEWSVEIADRSGPDYREG